jgi:hypothetical protein
MYLAMTLMYAGLAIGFDGPIALALFPLVLIAIQTQVIAPRSAISRRCPKT